jgi:hypothetical protein
MLGNFSKWEKSNWRSLAKASQTCTSQWCTGQCPVPRLAPRWTDRSQEKLRAPPHRTVQCASGAPSQRPVARSAGDTWISPMFTRPHQTVRCATGLSGVPQGRWLQRSALPNKGENRALFTVWWCTGLSGAPTDRRQPGPSKWVSNGS